MKNISNNKQRRDLLEYLVFLIIPFAVFLWITLHNKNEIDQIAAQKNSSTAPIAATSALALSTEESALIKQGIALINQKQYKKSIAIHLKVLAIHPSNTTALNNIGFAYGNLKQWDKGIAHCKKAIQLAPNFQLAKNNLNWMQREKSKQTP